MSGLAAVTRSLIAGEELDEQTLADTMSAVLSGEISAVCISGFLTALAAKGETPRELVAVARTLRSLSRPVDSGIDDLVDTAGTGGDGSHTFNISTASALLAAAAGAKVAKHGNRAASGNTGSADLLTAAGLCIELEPEQVAEVLRRHGFTFMFAPLHHPAMKHVAPIRMELGVRTVFNLAGPLSNPAGAKRQIAGVFAKRWLRPFAEALAELGGERALVVHSDDGLDEISIAAPTSVAELKDDGSIEEYRVTPEDFGLKPSRGLDEIKAADPAASWGQVKAVFAGKTGPARDVVLLNTAATLYVSGLAASLKEGAERAAATLDEGAATRLVNDLAATTTALKNS